MEVTNEKVVSHMRELFALWRRGELKTPAATHEIEYVVGGSLVLNSGVECVPSSPSLQETSEQSEELQASMREFVFGLPAEKGGLLQLVLKTMLELLLANRRK